MKRIVVVALALALVLTPAALMAQPRVAQAQGATYHVVKPGETLYGIAGMYGVSAQSIAAANNLVNPNYIYAGQRLVIPGAYVPPPPPPPPGGYYPPPSGCGSYYQVQSGDTLTGIAYRHGTSVVAIASANGIPYPYNRIYAGQRLYIPCPGGPKPPPGHRPPPGHKPPPAKPTARPNLPTAGCPREIQIVDPKVGQHLSGTVMIVGTASHPDFQFYKLEYAVGHTPLESTFHSIGEVRRQQVWDGVLGTWYVGNMPANPYTLRLTVVDNRGQYPRPCDVKVFLNQ